MALLERVGTLLRANLNDLVDKAEDPEKMLKQLVLDMENQLLQVKTQAAIAIADQHLLEKKKKEHDDAVDEWQRKAELAVQKQQDDLARAALHRSLSHKQMSEGFAQQLEDQKSETETLRTAFGKLQQKLKETESRCELLIAQHRRARVVGKANQARTMADASQNSVTMNRFRTRIMGQEAQNDAAQTMLDSDSLEDRFTLMEKEEQVDQLLQELKGRRAKSA